MPRQDKGAAGDNDVLKFEKRDYQDNEPLDRLAHLIARALPELSTACASRFKAFYSSVELDHVGGKCRRLDGAVRSQTHLDFFILIHKGPFIEADALHRIRMLCHELYHIDRDRNIFVVRHHAGDFCEIAAHDSWSYRLALSAMRELGIHYDNEAEARRYARIPPPSV